jgi:hypothetical protein
MRRQNQIDKVPINFSSERRMYVHVGISVDEFVARVFFDLGRTQLLERADNVL